VNFTPIGKSHACRVKNIENYLDATQILAIGLAGILPVEVMVNIV